MTQLEDLPPTQLRLLLRFDKADNLVMEEDEREDRCSHLMAHCRCKVLRLLLTLLFLLLT